MIEEKETSVAEETSRLWKEILVKRPNPEPHWVTSLLAMIEEKETSVAEETSRLWKEILVKRGLWKDILVKRYQWNRQKLLIDALKPITLADLTTFAQTISQVDRRSLSVGIYGQGKDPPRDLLAP
ncbi:hypothetical protein T484DRAFT_1842538, partial [Baffinella frigidus]